MLFIIQFKKPAALIKMVNFYINYYYARHGRADKNKSQKKISNGNKTSCRPIRSVIIRVITKSDDRAAGVQFVYHDMITDRTGRHEVLLPINKKKIRSPRKEE